MTQPDIIRFAEWAEKFEAKATPEIDISRLLGATPLCARKTIKERVEPFATEYDNLTDQLPWTDDDGPPDPRFYRPTPRLRRLWKRIEELRPQAFRTIPNPEYTEECAEEWERNRRKPFNQTEIVIGQSYAVPENTNRPAGGGTERSAEGGRNASLTGHDAPYHP